MHSFSGVSGAATNLPFINDADGMTTRQASWEKFLTHASIMSEAQAYGYKTEIDSTCVASISAISSATLRGKASMNWRWSATSSMLLGFRRSLFSTSPNLAGTAATMRRGTRDNASFRDRIKRCFLLMSKSLTFSRISTRVSKVFTHSIAPATATGRDIATEGHLLTAH